MNISDQIADAILSLMENHEGTAQIKRNELAQQLGCVPSQINYVITSRFTPEQGYIVESRRGGGGYIRIIRVDYNKKHLFMHVINSMGDSIDEASARIILENLTYDNFLTKQQAKIILSAITDHVLRELEPPQRNKVRASILKSMLLNSL